MVGVLCGDFCLHGDLVWGGGGRIAVCNVIAMGPLLMEVSPYVSMRPVGHCSPLLCLVFSLVPFSSCYGKMSIAKLFPSNLLLFLYDLLIFFWKFGWDDWWLWPVLKAKEKKLN